VRVLKKPTEEQVAACDVFASGEELALIAGAGTGKTTTLELMGRRPGQACAGCT
jgi:Lhr-like helicase